MDVEKVPLLLLKTRSTPDDSYEEHFGSKGIFAPIFVPVLEHRLKQESVSEVTQLIQTGGFSGKGSKYSKYGGLIFTSQRAVEAFATIIHGLRDNDVDLSVLFASHVPFYVVGPATARGVSSLDLQCQILGEETGNGDALAPLILDHFNRLCYDKPETERTLLFLVGEQRRDIIPRSLQSTKLSPASRIGVHEIPIYETEELESFPAHLRNSIDSATRANRNRQWIAVFSPTGCRAMLEGLGLLDNNAQLIQAQQLQPRSCKVVTIGPTTQAYLFNRFAFEADACASSPSPKGVEDAIRAYEESHRA